MGLEEQRDVIEYPIVDDFDTCRAELGLDRPVARINAFIEAELARLEAVAPARFERGEVLPKLNGLFHRSLAQAWA